MKKIVYNLTSESVIKLMELDPKLKDLCQRVKSVEVSIDDDYFKSLIVTILNQQLSSKVASIIVSRFFDLLGHSLEPKKVLEIEDDQYRLVGLSYQKIKYIRSLSKCIVSNEVDLDKISQLDDDKVKEMLLKVKGIGPWSVDMFLMFSLGREDVFSSLDLGLRNAVKKIYHNDLLTQQEIEEISKRWKPYRSVASHFLWHMHDQNGQK